MSFPPLSFLHGLSWDRSVNQADGGGRFERPEPAANRTTPRQMKKSHPSQLTGETFDRPGNRCGRGLTQQAESNCEEIAESSETGTRTQARSGLVGPIRTDASCLRRAVLCPVELRRGGT